MDNIIHMDNFKSDLDELLDLYYKYQKILDDMDMKRRDVAADKYYEARSKFLKYGEEPDFGE